VAPGGQSGSSCRPCDVRSKMPLPESARYTHAEAGIAEAMVCGILWTRS
jgi:hypothetical protein